MKRVAEDPSKAETLVSRRQLGTEEECFAALTARDARFDGQFFVGVTTTGIYCRPVCPARTPKRSNCTFHANAAAAEAAGFRPCLRCRPELAPGRAPIDRGSLVAARIADRIRSGVYPSDRSIEDLAADFGIGERQLRRIVQAEFGVTISELVTTHRLLLAKRLLTETALPVGEVALASGFASIRRFQDAFRTRYQLTPTEVRGKRRGKAAEASLRLRLDYREPFAYDSLLAFLGGHGIPGVEAVRGDSYMRSVRLGSHEGWLRVRPGKASGQLTAEISLSLVPVLAEVLAGLRRLFDLDADSSRIDAQLMCSEELCRDVQRTRGVRVPGAFNSFEVAWRGILGQQVSVAGANTLARRLTLRLGDPIETPFPEITHLTPTLESLIEGDLEGLGLMPTRLDTVVQFSKAVQRAPELLEPLPEESILEDLLALRGVGPWTASYLALRCHRDPDAFMEGDLAVRRVISDRPSARELAKRSLEWKPWRAYALMHLWNRNSDFAKGPEGRKE